MKKVFKIPDYTGTNKLVSALAATDSDEDAELLDDDYWEENDSQPTALEFLFVLSYVLTAYASYHEFNEETSQPE